MVEPDFTFEAHTVFIVDTANGNSLSTASLKIIDAHVSDDQTLFLLMDPNGNKVS